MGGREICNSKVVAGKQPKINNNQPLNLPFWRSCQQDVGPAGMIHRRHACIRGNKKPPCKKWPPRTSKICAGWHSFVGRIYRRCAIAAWGSINLGRRPCEPINLLSVRERRKQQRAHVNRPDEAVCR